MSENNTALSGSAQGTEALTPPKIRIVVADDHPIFRDGLCKLLALEDDFEVVAQASDGRQVLEVLQQTQPDILLLDLRMPVVDGIQVVRWIKGSGLTARTVILTGFSRQSDVREAIRAGANAYLLKDVTGGEMLRTIRSVHRGKYRISGKRARELAANVSSADLKPSEMEILALIVEGHDNGTIAAKLGLRKEAVKYHLKGIFSKLGVTKRGAAARQAIERGLLGVH